MSLIEDAQSSADPSQIRWIAYGLLAAAGVAVVYDLIRPGPLAGAAAVVLPLAAMATALNRPEAFEVKARGGRAFNFLFALPALGLLVDSLSRQMVDASWGPLAALVGGALGFAAGFGLKARAGLEAPLALMIATTVFGAT